MYVLVVTGPAWAKLLPPSTNTARPDRVVVGANWLASRAPTRPSKPSRRPFRIANSGPNSFNSFFKASVLSLTRSKQPLSRAAASKRLMARLPEKEPLA